MAWNLYNRLSNLFLVGVGLVIFGIAEYYVDIKPPKFRRHLEDELTQNTSLMQSIGGWRQTQFNYTDNENKNTFYLIVTGNCNDSFIRINGSYTDDKYAITDSVISRCK
jgi:hypothetical protein